jgi:DNA-binding NarL/FixJ family response regulator
MSVVVCDDHLLFLDALASELARFGQEVVSASDNPSDALRAVVNLAPDVCLVDLALGPDSGLALADSVRSSSPGTAIILLTGADATDVWPAVESGAVDGAVSKICDIAVLVAAAAASGGRPTQPAPGAHGTGVGDHAAPGRRRVEPANRRPARDLAQHRARSRPQPPQQAAGAQQGEGGGLGGPTRRDPGTTLPPCAHGGGPWDLTGQQVEPPISAS